MIAEHCIVNKRNTGDPVTFGNIPIGLQIILSAGKIPHEITPVHEVHLIREEELQVFSERRAIIGFLLSTVFITNTFSFDIRPLFISLHMASLRRIHTREEHAELRHILIGRFIARDHIMIFLAFHFRRRSILGMSLFFNRDAHISFHTQFNRSIIGLSVEQRSVSVLLTVQVILEREDIIRRVLIHRCICIRANDQSSIAAIADEDNRKHDYTGIEPTPEILPLRLGILDVRTFLGVPDSPCKESDREHKANPHTGIERTAKDIHKQQFEPSDNSREARNNAVQDDQQDCT